jgi:hypothetical protein
MRVSKAEHELLSIVAGSTISLHIKANDENNQPTHLVLEVTGEAARIPSTTNSRLNMFRKSGVAAEIAKILRGQGNPYLHAKKALALLNTTRVISTINPQHRIRLAALSRLYDAIKIKPRRPLICDKDNRWLVTVHIHRDLHRVDTHNLTKPICDWLQEVGLIDNDKFIECFPVRNADFATETPDTEKLYIAMRRLEDVRKEVAGLITSMLR